jgi:CRISPR-associated protein Csd1
MLSLLVKYAQDHGLASEPGFAGKNVRWGICCDKQGRFTELVEFGDIEDSRNRGRKFTFCPDLSQPELIAGGETRCHFLAETAGVICLQAKGEVDERTLRKHAYFLKMLEDASTALPALVPYWELLRTPHELDAARMAMDARKVKPNDSVTLVCEGDCALERKDWHPWWREFRGRIKAPAPRGPALELIQMRCLVSGEMKPPVGTHPAIRGLSDVGGQPNTLLVSFDKDAFGSYGLEQSANAALGADAAAAYRTALNDLIEKTGKRIGSSKVVHWFKDAVEPADDPFAILVDPPHVQEATAQKSAAELLSSISSARRANLGDNRYYALTLSGSGGRVMVRDWMDGSFAELAANVDLWFKDLSIVRLDGGGLAFDRGIKALATSCLRGRRPGADSKDFDLSVRRIADRLLRPALKSGPIPDIVAAQAIARIRAEAGVENRRGGQSITAHSSTRMAVLKAFVVRKLRAKGDDKMADQIGPSLGAATAPAYHCGRLMAVLAALQKRALGDVGAGVVQRYYAAASTSPSLVFGRLIRTSQFHLGKLEPGLAWWYEGLIAEVVETIGVAMPSVLDLESQSLFALGYYHQLADLRRKKKGFEEVEVEEENSDGQAS